MNPASRSHYNSCDMSETEKDRSEEREGLEEVYQGLTTLGNRVESVFADCVLALVEQDDELANTLREDNVRTRDAWFELDKTCTAIMSAGQLSEWKARFLSATIKIAMDMKRMADESFVILEQMDNLSAGNMQSVTLERIPRMAEITQDMLTDSVQALVDENPGEARAPKTLHRELVSLNEEIYDDITDRLSEGETSAGAAVSLILVARTLQKVGDYALDISMHVRRLFGHNHVEIPPEES